jgi:putative transposase
LLKGVQIRLNPTPEQEEILWKHVDGFRTAYNWGLAEQMRRFEQGEKHLSDYDLRDIFKQYQKTNEFLKGCNVNGLCIAIFDLGQAYRRFFKYHKEHPGEKFSKKKIERYKRISKSLTHYDMIAHPKFKVKRNATAVFAMQNDKLNFYGESKGVSISGVGKVKYRTQEKLPEGNGQGKFYNPRVSYTKNEKWVLTFAFDVKNESIKLNDYGMGIDLGVKVTADVSCNGKHTVYKNVNKSKRIKKLEQHKKRLQRHASRQIKGSKGQLETYLKLGKLEHKIANIRRDFRHKMTTEIVNQLPKVIVMENLNIRGMMKNRHLSKAIGEQGLSTIQNYVQYKSVARSIRTQYADRFYPSSKKCSNCGAIKKDLKLKDRKYVCHNCGIVKCRDSNASENLEALAILT